MSRTGKAEWVRIPKGHVWLVGDNLSNSTDSRTYGPVPLAIVKGQVLARVSEKGVDSADVRSGRLLDGSEILQEYDLSAVQLDIVMNNPHDCQTVPCLCHAPHPHRRSTVSQRFQHISQSFSQRSASLSSLAVSVALPPQLPRPSSLTKTLLVLRNLPVKVIPRI